MRYSDVEKYPNEWLNTITHEDIENNTFPVIIDRDQSDVYIITALSKKRWEDFTDAERRYWRGVVKGAYNDEDMNRVGYAVNHLAARLLQLPIYMKEYREELSVASDPHFTVPYDPEDYTNVYGKTTWAEEDKPSEEDVDTYLNNLYLIQDALQTNPAIYYLPSSMENLNYTGANNIEAMLQWVHNRIIDWTAETKILIDKTSSAWFYSGDIYAGEV